MGTSESIERLRALAERQQGRVSRAQLRADAVSQPLITSWLSQGHLRSVLPGVYAVGHVAPSRDADLWAAVLYAGPGAALSHATAAERRRLIDQTAVAPIQVSTPRRVSSVTGVRVHARVAVERELYDGLPVVSARQTLLGLAESRDQRALKRALAQLDYRRQLNFAVLIAICERGRPGSTTLRRALSQHDPKLAYTNEDLEAKFLALCRRWRLPPARLNVRVHGVLVDAHWPQANLVVELDGLANHSSPAQRRRDHGNDLKLRSYGLEVRRYDWVLLSGRDSKLVRLELERLLGIRA